MCFVVTSGKGLTSWLSFVVSTVSLSLSHWYPGSGVYLIVSIPDLCILTYLVYKLKKIVRSNNFSAQFIKIISNYKRLAITLMNCNRLHAWWSTLSRLATLFVCLLGS